MLAVPNSTFFLKKHLLLSPGSVSVPREWRGGGRAGLACRLLYAQHPPESATHVQTRCQHLLCHDHASMTRLLKEQTGEPGCQG